MNIKKILASNSATDIQALLNCGNRDMVSQVPLQTLITMNANSLPSSVWPTPLVNYINLKKQSIYFILLSFSHLNKQRFNIKQIRHFILLH